MIRRLACIVCTTMLAGCGVPPPLDATPRPQASEAPVPNPKQDLPNEQRLVVPLELNTARSAGMAVAHLPPVADAHTHREIRLHAALYRAAYGLSLDHEGARPAHFVLLESAGDAGRGDLPISRRNFHLRVLASLADLSIPIAWVQPGSSGQEGEHRFPIARESVTRLGIRIVERMEEQAAVSAEISHHRSGAGSSRHRMVATWDGQAWTIQPGRIRVQW